MWPSCRGKCWDNISIRLLSKFRANLLSTSRPTLQQDTAGYADSIVEYSIHKYVYVRHFLCEERSGTISDKFQETIRIIRKLFSENSRWILMGNIPCTFYISWLHLCNWPSKYKCCSREDSVEEVLVLSSRPIIPEVSYISWYL